MPTFRPDERDLTSDVVGVDPRSGRELWRTSVGVAEGLRVDPGGDRFVIRGSAAADSHLVDLDAATGIEVTDTDSSGDPSQFALSVDQPYLDNRQEVDVAVERSGTELWSASLPGFVLTLHDDLVVIIDQTGGTGVFDGHADTRVSEYDASTGELFPLSRLTSPAGGLRVDVRKAQVQAVGAAGPVGASPSQKCP